MASLIHRAGVLPLHLLVEELRFEPLCGFGMMRLLGLGEQLQLLGLGGACDDGGGYRAMVAQRDAFVGAPARVAGCKAMQVLQCTVFYHFAIVIKE